MWIIAWKKKLILPSLILKIQCLFQCMFRAGASSESIENVIEHAIKSVFIENWKATKWIEKKERKKSFEIELKSKSTQKTSRPEQIQEKRWSACVKKGIQRQIRCFVKKSSDKIECGLL